MKILTRGDMDGLMSAVLLTLVHPVKEIRFAHPKDVQDGKVPCTKEDIIVNLPFVPGCGLWFDHHVSEESKLDDIGRFEGRFEVAPSAARVVYNHYKRQQFDKFAEMLKETDRIDSAQLTLKDVTEPQGWILLAYTLDPRTGLGPEFQKYFRWLVEFVKEVPLEKVLKHAEVKKRCDRVLQEIDEHREFLKKASRRDGSVIITDLRGQKEMPVGNRFLVYAMHPEATCEVRIHHGKGGATVNAAIGHSIFKRTSKVNIGEMCARYGGGGHRGAGTVQLAPATAEAKLKEIVATLKKNAPS